MATTREISESHEVIYDGSRGFVPRLSQDVLQLKVGKIANLEPTRKWFMENRKIIIN